MLKSMWRIVSQTIGLENITGTHSGDLLQQVILKVLNNWDLVRRVQSITTDNGIH